ncbi:MAG: hypothetical protein NT098_02440 [Candidatus Parcubacteria bacterium]|nr:hypothetical protein [Candidatus Parcubacteria bacterium]
MTATTTLLVPDVTKQMVDLIFSMMDKIKKDSAHIVWGWFISFLKEYWLAVLLVIFVLFITITFKAMLGRWGSLGSFLYNFFYFGILLIIGLIWGPEVFVADYFNATCVVVLYPICYVLSGYIMDKMKVRKY